MGRPKKSTIDHQIEEAEKLEFDMLQILKALPLETERGKYIRDIIIILHALGKPLEDLVDELMCYFSDLVKVGVTNEYPT
jgi:hypothetical protein